MSRPTAYNPGKWQQLANELYQDPGRRVTLDDPVSPSILARLKSLGLNTRKDNVFRRSETGKTYDLYTVTVWAPAEDELTEPEQQLVILRNTRSRMLNELDIVERELYAHNRRGQLIRKRRKALKEEAAQALDKIDALRAIHNLP